MPWYMYILYVYMNTFVQCLHNTTLWCVHKYTDKYIHTYIPCQQMQWPAPRPSNLSTTVATREMSHSEYLLAPKQKGQNTGQNTISGKQLNNFPETMYSEHVQTPSSIHVLRTRSDTLFIHVLRTRSDTLFYSCTQHVCISSMRLRVCLCVCMGMYTCVPVCMYVCMYVFLVFVCQL
jgi:hypothetical protein